LPRRVASPQQVSSAQSRWSIELMRLMEVGKLAAYLWKIRWLRWLGCATSRDAGFGVSDGSSVGDRFGRASRSGCRCSPLSWPCRRPASSLGVLLTAVFGPVGQRV